MELKERPALSSCSGLRILGTAQQGSLRALGGNLSAQPAVQRESEGVCFLPSVAEPWKLDSSAFWRCPEKPSAKQKLPY